MCHVDTRGFLVELRSKTIKCWIFILTEVSAPVSALVSALMWLSSALCVYLTYGEPWETERHSASDFYITRSGKCGGLGRNIAALT